jgi:hypothetical protein
MSIIGIEKRENKVFGIGPDLAILLLTGLMSWYFAMQYGKRHVAG